VERQMITARERANKMHCLIRDLREHAHALIGSGYDVKFKLDGQNATPLVAITKTTVEKL
jgi:hypothetical protein